jgi:hypothetical protein
MTLLGVLMYGQNGVFLIRVSTVYFMSETADISGSTSFYNVTIDAAANLLMQTGSTMKIGGVMNNVGVWCSLGWKSNDSRVQRLGAKCCNSYASTNRYSSLILSGSGVKTMPAVDMSILGI